MNEEPRVRDVWKTFAHRDAVGHRLNARVGARGWERPRFGKFKRFFKGLGMPDPWDPSAPEAEIGLGEVGIGPPKRQVAPHAAPPTPAGAKPKTPTGIPNIPGMPAAPPRPEGRPAPQIGQQRRDDTAELKRKLEEKEKARVADHQANVKRFKVDQPVVKLPMRPDMPAPGAGPAARPQRPEKPKPTMRPAPARPTPGLHPTRMAVESARRPALPEGPEEIFEEEPGSMFAPGARRPEPAPSAALPEPTAAPAVRAMSPPLPRLPPAATPPPAAPRPGPPPRAGGGLDDMFGMGGENTRVRMPKKDDAAKPRRPMVSSDADLAASGVDRRLPPPKPPSVTASPGSAGAEPMEDDE